MGLGALKMEVVTGLERIPPLMLPLWTPSPTLCGKEPPKEAFCLNFNQRSTEHLEEEDLLKEDQALITSDVHLPEPPAVGTMTIDRKVWQPEALPLPERQFSKDISSKTCLMLSFRKSIFFI